MGAWRCCLAAASLALLCIGAEKVPVPSRRLEKEHHPRPKRAGGDKGPAAARQGGGATGARASRKEGGEGLSGDGPGGGGGGRKGRRQERGEAEAKRREYEKAQWIADKARRKAEGSEEKEGGGSPTKAWGGEGDDKLIGGFAMRRKCKRGLGWDGASCWEGAPAACDAAPNGGGARRCSMASFMSCTCVRECHAMSNNLYGRSKYGVASDFGERRTTLCFDWPGDPSSRLPTGNETEGQIELRSVDWAKMDKKKEDIWREWYSGGLFPRQPVLPVDDRNRRLDIAPLPPDVVEGAATYREKIEAVFKKGMMKGWVTKFGSVHSKISSPGGVPYHGSCPNDCSGNGQCIPAKWVSEKRPANFRPPSLAFSCRCFLGFSGRDCSQASPDDPGPWKTTPPGSRSSSSSTARTRKKDKSKSSGGGEGEGGGGDGEGEEDGEESERRINPRSICINGCQGHGECDAGFCACGANRLGADCGVKYKDYERHHHKLKGGNGCKKGSCQGDVRHYPLLSRSSGMVWAPGPPAKDPGFKIYVYELPAVLHVGSHVLLNQDAAVNDWVSRGGNSGYTARSAEFSFYSWILQDWTYRTIDPAEASLFYVPALLMWGSHCRFAPGGTQQHLARLLRYIDATFPFYRRRGGRDHVIFVSNDIGGCVLSSRMAHMIVVSHLGRPWHLQEENSARKKGRSLDELAPHCYDKSKDVVVPPRASDLKTRPAWLENPGVRPPGGATLFFKGSCDVIKSYAIHVRRKVCELADTEEDFIIIDTSSAKLSARRTEIARKFARSKRPKNSGPSMVQQAMEAASFCFVPSGRGPGFGDRLAFAWVAGCIPVIIQPNVTQPFVEILPYRDFALTFEEEDIPNLPRILRAVPPERVTDMRLALAKHWEDMMWESAVGGRAPQNVAEMLRLRARSLGFAPGSPTGVVGADPEEDSREGEGEEGKEKGRNKSRPGKGRGKDSE